MNIRKLKLGNKNIVGYKITKLRNDNKMLVKDLLAKLQVKGVEISLPALSLLEAQKRPVSDNEVKALCEIFKVSADYLLDINIDT